jgi:hypothetical protein
MLLAGVVTDTERPQLQAGCHQPPSLAGTASCAYFCKCCCCFDTCDLSDAVAVNQEAQSAYKYFFDRD